MKKLFTVLLSLLICLSLAPVSAKAAPPPVELNMTLSETELADRNLSLGTITWNDDMASGQINVTNGPVEGTYFVCLREFLMLNDMAKTKKDFAKNAAISAFLPIRQFARDKGWWDCKWTINSLTKNKVKATAKVEYKAVKIDERSREVIIKQISTKKKGKWKTTYVIDGKKYSADSIYNLFS